MFKKILVLSSIMVCSNVWAAICSSTGQVRTLLVSEAEAGVWINAPVTEPCKCSTVWENSFLVWIDMDQIRGEVMMSAAMTANVTKPDVVTVTYEDGTGEGHPENSSIAHRYWSDCRLTSIEF